MRTRLRESRFPAHVDELALHERVLAGDAVTPVDVFHGLMDPLAEALRHDLRCTEDEAYDSSVDAVLAYLEEPERCDRQGPSKHICHGYCKETNRRSVAGADGRRGAR
jgi:hypothetical protein